MLIAISCLLLVASVIFVAIGCNYLKNAHTINIQIDNQNKILEENNKKLKEENNTLSTKNDLLFNEKTQLQKQKNELYEDIGKEEQRLLSLKDTINSTVESQKELSKQAFENYCETLDRDYQLKEKEYQAGIDKLENFFTSELNKMNAERAKEQAELDRIKATRTAAREAQLKEKEIKEKREFYMLCPKTSEIDDVKRLERIKPELHNPRILSMLIWSTFFQKPMTALCNNVLGTNTVTGIYKITNQETDECYIGQAADMAKRWKDHAKCGLGIDTPANNKLYKAIQEYGIWNFTWELLEACPREELNAKEKYYIQLYDSCNFGYNSNKGVSN